MILREKIVLYISIGLICSAMFLVAGCSALGKPIIEASAVKVDTPEISAVKGEVAGDASIVKAQDVSAVKIEAEKVSTGVMIGNKDESKKVGGDYNILTDPELMKSIFKNWAWFTNGAMLLLIGLMKWNAGRVAKIYERQIKVLEVEKEDYKSRFIATALKDEKDLEIFRKQHEKSVEERLARGKG